MLRLSASLILAGVTLVAAFASLQSGRSVTSTPEPTGPCPPRGTPPVTYAPTPTPETPTPTPGPTSRDVVITTTIPFCNDAGQSASDLHVHFAFPYSGRTFVANPSGCPEASFEPAEYGLDTFDLDVDWGVDCVDPGESLILEFTYACGDVPCNTPQPYCYTWTLFGEPVYQGQGDCLTQGDVDCAGGVTAVDALKVLRFVVSLPVSKSEPCPEIGQNLPPLWGDVDCNGSVKSVDALKVLRFTAQLPYSQTGSCPDIGLPVD